MKSIAAGNAGRRRHARSWKKNTTVFTAGSTSAMPVAIATEPVKA